MKEAIEKAIKNGFDITQFTQNEPSDYIGVKEQTSPYFLEFDFGNGRTSDISTYAIIFGTPFIDTLDGEYLGCKNKKCEGYSKTRNDKFHIHDHCKAGFKRPGMQCEGDSRGEGGFIGTRPALYHLQKMSDPAISRDIDKLKEYVRTLI